MPGSGSTGSPTEQPRQRAGGRGGSRGASHWAGRGFGRRLGHWAGTAAQTYGVSPRFSFSKNFSIRLARVAGFAAIISWCST